MPERAPDHVSPDTGRRLREAKLEWQPRVGDWCWCGVASGMTGVVRSIKREAFLMGPGSVLLRLSVPVGDNDALPRTENASRCVWLPTTGQLLDLLVQMGKEPMLDYMKREWFVFWYPAGESKRPSRVEALAEAWLRVRAQEVQP